MNNNFQEYNEKEYNNVEKKEKKKSIRNKVTLFIVLLIVCFFSTYFIVDRLTNSNIKMSVIINLKPQYIIIPTY